MALFEQIVGNIGGQDWFGMGKDYFMTKDNQRFQSDQARHQMQWQQNMSNTAYQRAMADMRSAGLNPMLAYQQGGASSQGGAAGKGGVTNSATTASALQVKRQKQELVNMKEQAQLTYNKQYESNAIRMREKAATKLINQNLANAKEVNLGQKISNSIAKTRVFAANYEELLDKTAAGAAAKSIRRWNPWFDGIKLRIK